MPGRNIFFAATNSLFDFALPPPPIGDFMPPVKSLFVSKKYEGVKGRAIITVVKP